MKENIDTMKELLLKELPKEKFLITNIKDVAIFRVDNPHKKKPELYRPFIILLAQGEKRIFLGNKTYIYDSKHYYVQSIPLPIECETIVEKDKPMLGVAIRIDPQMISEILFEINSSVPTNKKIYNSLYDAEITDDILEATNRLLKTLDSENDSKILGPIYLKEILYKILSGDNGEILRELVINNRGFFQIAKIINKIHEDYSQSFDIQELAKEAGMSSTAFHTAFKAMTNTSPLQYIKNIRLHKAKELIKNTGEKANIAARLVGYESSSQFSREYKRCFGVSPTTDKQTYTTN
ncbi:MAG: AraC family transcriptional regulator [Pleomorphochaeta sp.]